MDNVLAIIISLLLTFFGVQDGAIDAETVSSTGTFEVVEVVDGDTIKVLIDGQVESVRYIGIDTPEPYRDKEPACYSLEASDRNRELVEGQQVTLVSGAEDKDKYDRLLRYVYVDDIFVNEVLVREGYADTLTIPPNTEHRPTFSVARDKARSESLGLWSACR